MNLLKLIYRLTGNYTGGGRCVSKAGLTRYIMAGADPEIQMNPDHMNELFFLLQFVGVRRFTRNSRSMAESGAYSGLFINRNYARIQRRGPCCETAATIEAAGKWMRTMKLTYAPLCRSLCVPVILQFGVPHQGARYARIALRFIRATDDVQSRTAACDRKCNLPK